jgi:DNA-binding HxlR family transcriptional regulator
VSKYSSVSEGDDAALFLKVIHGKWKLPIIKSLLDGAKCFSELQHDAFGISANVLADNLRKMERDGLIARTVCPQMPPKVEYALTETGKSILLILLSMQKWVSEHGMALPDGSTNAKEPLSNRATGQFRQIVPPPCPRGGKSDARA